MGTAFADEFGADIKRKCTLGSLAEHIWMHTLQRPIPKLQTQEMHDLWQRANRGGFCGPLSHFRFTAPEGEQIYKVDVTSLYPSAAGPIEFATSAGVQKPLAAWYRGFPVLPTSGWEHIDFGGCAVTKKLRHLLGAIHGICVVEFDQTGLPFPVLLKKMSCNQFETLAPVMQGEEAYTLPQICQAIDFGVRIRLKQCWYVHKSREVFADYMKLFSARKNGADALKAELKKKPAAERTDDDRAASNKAEYDRSIAKLFLNGLLGRNNMKIAREQEIITRSFNDLVTITCDPLRYDNATIEEVQCGESWAYVAKFSEGDYSDHIRSFNVCPYISAYMLGYSKMLMQCSLQHLACNGCKPLYTDTDSIVFAATPERWEAYKAKFVPTVKTFGGMELEGTYRSFITVGPKKYACIHDDGSYEWHCNGLPARHNTSTDVVGMFDKVLDGTHVDLPYFSIKATSAYTLKHSTDASKRLRFLCLKGRVEKGRVRWWRNEDEFRAHADSIVPVGWEEVERPPTAVSTPIPAPLDLDRQEPRNRKRNKSKNNPTREEQESFVYVLTNAEKDRYYIGFSPTPDKRLLQHNAGIGAAETRGVQWTTYCRYAGFADRQAALRFEKLLQMYNVARLNDIPEVVERVTQTNPEFAAVGVIVDGMDADECDLVQCYVDHLFDDGKADDESYSTMRGPLRELIGSEAPERSLRRMVNIAVLAQGGRQTAPPVEEPTTNALRALWAAVTKRVPYESPEDAEATAALFAAHKRRAVKRTVQAAAVVPAVGAPVVAPTADDEDFAVSLHEPIDEARMEQTITYIEERMHKLAPPGESREHDKVRDVYEYLVGLRDRPKRVGYVYRGAIGRLYASDTLGNARSKSLQGCFSGLRARLVGHVGHDIDIANSLPSLTVQWIHKLARLDESDFSETDVTWLAHYVDNRAQWLRDMTAHYGCGRGAAKALLLTALFGGRPEKHYEEHGIKPRDTFRPLQKVVDELSALRPRVIEYMNTLPKYKAVYDLKLGQKGSAAAAERSVFALITQEIEDHVMHVIREYLHERGIEIYSLIHDGFIASECSEELLRGLEAHVAEYGWTISLAEKPLYGLQDEPVPELAPLIDEPVSLLNVYDPDVDYTPLKADDWQSLYFRDWTAPCTYWETA